MIGQTIKIHTRQNGRPLVSVRKIDGEHYEYGRRIYDMTDPITGEPHTAVADDIDRMFKPTKIGRILPRGSKGPVIVGPQKRNL